MSDDLNGLIKRAAAMVAAMTPEEKAAMIQAQAESWVRGEMGMGESVGRSTVVINAAELATLRAQIAALTAEFDAAKVANILGQRLLVAASELASYASYAEIVGGVRVNRTQVRQWCDAVFALCRELPKDEDGEPCFATLEPAPARDEALIRAAIEAAADACNETHTTGRPHGSTGTIAAIRALATPEGIAAIRERAGKLGADAIKGMGE